MAVPTHGSGCQTRVYPVNCWDCAKPIHIFQCSCGSAVLFDALGPVWDEHDCWSSEAGGIGGSGYSGWNALDVLQSAGMKVTSDVMAAVFPNSQTKQQSDIQQPQTVRVEPLGNMKEQVIAIIRDVHSETKLTKSLDELGVMGQELLGLDKAKNWMQLTLIANNERPNRSFTCIVPDTLGTSATSKKDQIVFAQIEGRVAGETAIWLMLDFHVL